MDDSYYVSFKGKTLEEVIDELTQMEFRFGEQGYEAVISNGGINMMVLEYAGIEDV